MRILYVLTSLGVGGAENQVIAVAERMAARGHSVAILALLHADEEWPVKLPVLRLNVSRNAVGLMRGLRFARNFCKLFRPDILHSHTFPANIVTRFLGIGLRTTLSGLRSAPVIINTIHNVHEGGWHRMAMYRLTSPLSREVTAVSSAAAERFVRLHAVPKKKMRVLTNGIDTEAFTPDPTRRRILRNQAQLGKDFLWLAIGRIVPAKDYPNLLRAFAIVRQAVPATRLWIAGEGNRSDIASINDLPSTDSEGVHWLGLRRDIPDLLDAADGFVLSSAWEGMPLVVGEAMAMAKPVVATNVGGVNELLANTGILVEPNDSKSLAEAMQTCMATSKEYRTRMGKAARERIVRYFSIDSKVEEWENFYALSLDRTGG